MRSPKQPPRLTDAFIIALVTTVDINERVPIPTTITGKFFPGIRHLVTAAQDALQFQRTVEIIGE